MDRFGFPIQASKGMVTPMLPTFDPNQTAHFSAFRQFVEFFGAQFKDPHLVVDVNYRQSYKDYIWNYFCRIFTAGEDEVLLDEVALHIEPPQQLFVHCVRLLRPGGTLFLLEPNPWHLLTQAFFLCARDLKNRDSNDSH